MRIMKKVSVAAMVMVLGCSSIPANVQAAVTATVTTNKGKVTSTKKETPKAVTAKTNSSKAKTTVLDAYILSRTKTDATFISTDGTKFKMPVVLDSSNKGDLVKVTFQGTLKKPSKISIKNQKKANTIVGTIDNELSGMSVIHIKSNGKDYSFLKDYTQINIKGSENEKVKVYYIDQTAVLIETAK